MNSETIFREWAAESVWSPWVKPVLFAHLSSSMIATASADAMSEGTKPNVSGIPRATGATAVLVDLPGAASIATGLALAEMGYRPVPLYNAVPVVLHDVAAPSRQPGSAEGAQMQGSVDLVAGPSLHDVPQRGPRAAVDMSQIIRLLVQGAENPYLKALSAHAAPAFLLDSRRRGNNATCEPGDFDNRSISLPTDFPSANFMLSQRIRDAIVIQERDGPPQQDLAHTLRRWQEAGIQIRTSVSGSLPQPIVISRPPRFRHMWYGALARLGMRQNPLGGFGGFLPVPSAG